MVSHCQFCTSSGRPSGGSAQGTLPRSYFSGLSRSHFKVAEREGFEPPIGLHLCRISSAVHSTTLPPLQAARVWAVLGEDGGADKPGAAGNSRRRQGVGPPDAIKTGGPMSHIEIAGRK